MSSPKLSIVIPALNESKIIESSLDKLFEQLSKDNLVNDCEVLVVSADGNDNTGDLAEAKTKQYSNLKVLRPGPKVGKGRDVQFGVMQANGQYILFTDADMATPPHHIKTMLDLLEQGAPVVIGTRDLSKIHNSMSRKIRSVISNILIQTLATPGISDTQCGFKGFRGDIAKELFEKLDSQTWGFDFEILAKARTRGYKIKKIKIYDWFDPKEDVMGLSGESDWEANLKTLKELKKTFTNRMTGKYRK